jgi:hypothetical protein
MIIREICGIVRNMRKTKSNNKSKKSNTKIGKKRSEMWKNLLVLCIALFVCFIITEVSLRLFTHQITQDMVEMRTPRVFQEGTHMNVELKPNATDQMIGVFNEYNITIKVNSLGWRDKEYTLKKPANTIRILILGDSFVFGEGVESSEIFGNVLEDMLNSQPQEMTHYEVFTMGVGGYTTDNEYLQYQDKGLKYDADIVILAMLPANDFIEQNRSKWLETDKSGLPVKILQPEFYIDKNNRRRNSGNLGTFASTKFHEFLNRYSYTYIALKNAVYKMVSKTSTMGRELCIQYDSELIDGFDKSMSIVSHMKKIADANNQEFYVYMIPAKYQYETDIYSLNNTLLTPCEKTRNEPERKIIAYLNDNSIKYIDPLPAFQENYEYENQYTLKIDGHWNQAGHELGAKTIFDVIKKI